MSLIYIIIIGLVQGITEFLPISSSAHLVIVPLFLKQTYQGLTFDVALHMGTLLALLIYFFKDWLLLIKKGIIAPKSKEGKLFWYIVLATFPAAIIGLIFESAAEVTLRNPWVISTALIFGSAALLFSDKKSKSDKEIRNIGIKESLCIGIAQALAIIPGISRSGITIAAGLLTGLKREQAAKFSFLLAVPIILGAGLLRISELKISNLNFVFFTGILCSLIAGLFSINFLLKYLKRANLNVFILYRIILAGIIILLTLIRII